MTYLGVFVGFLTTFFVLTRFLTTEEIGLARVLIDTGTLFIGLAQLGTSSSIIRFFPYFKTLDKKDPSHSGFFFWTVIIPLFGFAILTFLYWLLHDSIAAVFAEKSALFVNYYYAVLPLAFFMLYQTIFETNANVLMRIVFPRAVRELFLRLFLLAAYLLYAFRVVSMDGFIILLCGAYGLAALMNIIYLFAYGHISLRPNFHFVTRSLARQYAFYTLFQLTAAIATVLAPFISSYYITATMGLEYTGIFAIATYISTMVSIPNRSLNSIANPQLAQTTKDGDRQALTTLLKQVSNNSFLIGAFILAAIWLNIDLIFHILPNGNTYAVAKYVVLFLSFSQLTIATFNATISVLNFSHYYYLSLLYSFILTISAILFNNSLIPLYGMNGAALANLLSYLLYFALMLVTLAICSHTHPFSTGHLKTLCLIALLLAAGYTIDRLIGPIDSVSLIGLIGKNALWLIALLIAFCWRISPEINQVIKEKLNRQS
ncbi:MAG: oligosaccharide flippase family protein [Paludibacteraceae bacterium]|nr:oligosaccharide flippase family protein [Paludibacteraceae bacterium]